MRMILLSALSWPLAAAAAVTIQPGQTITVGPGAATQVTCAAPAAPAATSARSAGSSGAISSVSSSPVRSTEPGATAGAFCFCRPLPLQGSVDFNLVKVSLGPNGERNETTLRNYTRGPDCDKAIGNYPSCR